MMFDLNNVDSPYFYRAKWIDENSFMTVVSVSTPQVRENLLSINGSSLGFQN